LVTEEVANIIAEDWHIKKVTEYENGYRSLGEIIRKGNDQFILDLREESDSELEEIFEIYV
jgi:hypothetical protein